MQIQTLLLQHTRWQPGHFQILHEPACVVRVWEVCSLPVMVVLVDNGDGPRVQVDPEEVGPNLHAALQLVAALDSSQLAVDGVHAQCTCQKEELSVLRFKLHLGCQSEMKGFLT